MISLERFLDSQTKKEHALARLVHERDETRGLVHTPKEIVQQTWLWRETARRMSRHAAPLRSFLEEAGVFDPDRRPVVALTGAGTSDYVGVSIADLLRRAFKAPCYSWPTTRITAFPDAYLRPDQEYLVVHFARSGQSPESKAVLELSLKHFRSTTRHVVITCNPDGDLAKLARRHPDLVYPIVLHEACNDRGLAMTSSFSNMVAAGQAIAYLDRMDEFTDLIDRTAEAGDYLVETWADAVYDLADPTVERVIYLGNVDQFGAAVESALKTQEMTAGVVTATGEDTLALRHGPVSAVNSRSIVCFFLSANAYTRRYELDVLDQYRESFHEMGARTVVVGSHLPAETARSATHVITYDPDGRYDIPAFHQVNLSVMVGQMFGLFACCRRGLNADNPAVDRGLYSRTVQGVRLYGYRREAVSA